MDILIYTNNTLLPPPKQEIIEMAKIAQNKQLLLSKRIAPKGAMVKLITLKRNKSRVGSQLLGGARKQNCIIILVGNHLKNAQKLSLR